ncbi:MAG: ABC transporter permease, partial [Desulfuromonadales bacterium]|nr:ABC transporter permease [Desulfuromonadales bacterium]
MTASIIDLSLWDLVTVYSLLLMSIGLAHLLKAGQSKDLFWSGLRMFIQLLVVGYVLHLIFALETPLPVLLIL